ncbi:MAG: N-Acetyl-D-glucosamine ABC transport system, permease protein 2, partial [uncultured Thermomicrobiales bacterium]
GRSDRASSAAAAVRQDPDGGANRWRRRRPPGPCLRRTDRRRHSDVRALPLLDRDVVEDGAGGDEPHPGEHVGAPEPDDGGVPDRPRSEHPALVRQQHARRRHLGHRPGRLRQHGGVRIRPDAVPGPGCRLSAGPEHDHGAEHCHHRPEVHHPQRVAPLERLRRAHGPVPDRRLRHLPHEAVLRVDPERAGGGSPDRRRQPVPDVPPDRPAERDAGPHRPRHLQFPGELECLPRAADLRQQRGPLHVAARARLLPAGELHGLAGGDGERRDHHRPDRDLLPRLPALLRRKPDEQRDQGV